MSPFFHQGAQNFTPTSLGLNAATALQMQWPILNSRGSFSSLPRCACGRDGRVDIKQDPTPVVINRFRDDYGGDGGSTAGDVGGPPNDAAHA